MAQVPDELSCERLLEEHADWLNALALRLARDPEQAADLAQDAALRLIERPPARPEAVRTWLRRVVKNRAHDLRRGASRRTLRERGSAPPRQALTGEDVAASEEMRRHVAAALERLDEPYVETVRLAFYEELSIGEIAERMDVPYQTARARLRRGLERMRGALDREYGSRDAWAVPLLGPTGTDTRRDGTPTTSRPEPRRPRARWVATAGIAALVTAAIVAVGSGTWLGSGSVLEETVAEIDAGNPSSTRFDGTRGRSLGRDARGTAVPTLETPGATAPKGAETAASAVERVTIRGRLEDPGGRALEGAFANLVYIDEQRVWQRVPAQVERDGRFVAADVDASRVRDQIVIEAGADGFLTTTYSCDLSAVDDVRVELVRSLPVEGRVLLPDGEPAAGVRVTFWHGAVTSSRSTTDALGRYRLETRSDWDSDNVLFLERDGHDQERVVVPAAADVIAGVLRLEDVRVHDAAPVTGSLFDHDGKALVGVEVRLYCGSRDGEPAGKTVTTLGGRFVLEEVGRGYHDIEATWMVEDGDSSGLHGARAIAVHAGDRDVRLVGARVQRLRVVVRSAADGSPIVTTRLWARIGLERLRAASTANTATRLYRDGRSEFEFVVMEPGHYYFATGTYEHHAEVRRHLPLLGGDPVDIEIELRPLRR